MYVKVAFEVQQWVVAKSFGEDALSTPEFRIKDHVLPAEEPLRQNRDLNRSQQLLWVPAGRYLDASIAEAEWVPVRAPCSLPVSQGITTL